MWAIESAIFVIDHFYIFFTKYIASSVQIEGARDIQIFQPKSCRKFDVSDMKREVPFLCWGTYLLGFFSEIFKTNYVASFVQIEGRNIQIFQPKSCCKFDVSDMKREVPFLCWGKDCKDKRGGTHLLRY